jgi:hypothetical protein
VSSPEPFVLINAVDVPEGSDEEFVAAWQAARASLETRPGYLGTTLHQTVTREAEFRFVKSLAGGPPKSFRPPPRSDDFRAAGAGLASYRSHPGLYRVVGG